MKLSPEQLEKLIHQNLRALPDRRAPRSLESRVLAAIEARAARHWWQQSFREWPVAARGVFILFSAGLIKLALTAAVWVMADFNAAEVTNAFSNQFAWLHALRNAVGGVGELCAVIGRSIPTVWVYAVLGGIVALYATLFGLGATAYRMLYANSNR